MSGSPIPARAWRLLLAVVLIGCATQTATAPESAGLPTPGRAWSKAQAEPAELALAVATPPASKPLAKSPSTNSASPLPKSVASGSMASGTSGQVRLMAVGDVSLGWEAGRRIVRRGPHVPWTRVADTFAQADLVVANLECTISDRGTRWPTKNITIRAPLAAADSLVAGGIDVVSLANNHALDYGRDAFADTLKLLDQRGIGHAGGGLDADSAYAPLISTVNGVRLAFLGYVLPFSSRPSFNTRDWAARPRTPGLAIGTPEVIGRDVALATTQADVVVVMIHGGIEYSHRPSKRQKAVAQAALDAGASLVIGHHPHVLQGYRHGDGTLVAYSLGNFVFDRFEGDSNDSAILDVTLSSDGVVSLRWIPIVTERGFPRPAVGAEIPRVLAKVPEL